MSWRDLICVLRIGRWSEAKDMFRCDPSLMWTFYDGYLESITCRIVGYGQIELLDFMYDLILQQPQEKQEQLLRDTFEQVDKNGNAPILVAACYNSDIVEWLVQHCPSGAVILETKNFKGSTPAHCAAIFAKIYTLEFIALHAPSGLSALFMKDVDGRTPLDVASRSIKQRLLSSDTQRLGLAIELRTINECEFTLNSLPSLIFDVLRQSIEAQLRYLKPKNIESEEYMTKMRSILWET